MWKLPPKIFSLFISNSPQISSLSVVPYCSPHHITQEPIAYFNVFNGFLSSKFISAHDVGRVELFLDHFIGSLNEIKNKWLIIARYRFIEPQIASTSPSLMTLRIFPLDAPGGFSLQNIFLFSSKFFYTIWINIMRKIIGYQSFRKSNISALYLEKFSGDDDDWGGTVTNFLILELGEFDKDLSSGMFNFELSQNSSTYSDSQTNKKRGSENSRKGKKFFSQT